MAERAQAVNHLATLLGAGGAVALTGAGISVPSGIPDFRTPGSGLWTKVDPFAVAHLEAFRRDPVSFWRFYRERFLALADKEPNPVHRFLAELEAADLLRAVVTQNVDRLHQKAGSREVVEVHGSIERARCLRCPSAVPFAEVLKRAAEDPAGVPRCSRCGAPLKPDVVLFGELLPEAPFARAQALCAEASLLLCLGTSLEVEPVASLPSLTVAGGGAVAIITRGPTPLDRLATVRIDADLVEVVQELGAALARRGAPPAAVD